MRAVFYRPTGLARYASTKTSGEASYLAVPVVAGLPCRRSYDPARVSQPVSGRSNPESASFLRLGALWADAARVRLRIRHHQKSFIGKVRQERRVFRAGAQFAESFLAGSLFGRD